jgi:LuxR family transcriptional regulator, maltose regulon positive regulatory protein
MSLSFLVAGDWPSQHPRRSGTEVNVVTLTDRSMPLAGISASVPRSKFGAPVVPARAIDRARLMSPLDHGEWRVAIVTGGPASGKTVLTAQWFATLGPTAREWVTLDANDDRPGRFWVALTLAFERAVPGALRRTLALAADMPEARPEFLDQLLTEWSAVESPVVIVLDDLHHIRVKETIEDLGFVIEHVPQGSRMLLTSRVEPHLPVGRWRGRSWVVEIRQRDLALTLPEATELVSALGEQRVTAPDVERLWRHTEGWVAGLRLAVAGLKDRADVSAAVTEFSGRTPMVGDLLADELLHHASKETSEFLLRTSVADVLDAELCNALSGRSDSGELLRRMEADLQFVNATGDGTGTYRYHPLLVEMLRSELGTRRPEEAQSLNRLAAAVLEGRGDIAGSARCLLAAGDVDRAFSLVSDAAISRADFADNAGLVALVNIFPRDLVPVSVSRMLIYALILGLSGRLEEAHAWLQRASTRLGEDPAARAKELAIVAALQLLAFTCVGEAGEEIDAGRRAVEEVEAGLDMGQVGRRVRMNLVRGYLLVDQPREADRALREGNPGDEISTLVLAPALAARIALREGRLSEVAHRAAASLWAARAFGVENHLGTIDAYLALAGAQIDHNELEEASVTFRRIEERLELNLLARVYIVLLAIEKSRVAAALDDFDDAFTVLREARKLVDHVPRSALRNMLDAATVRCYLQAGERLSAWELVGNLPPENPAHVLLSASLDLAEGRIDDARARLAPVKFETMRDRLNAEVLLARAAIESGHDATDLLTGAVKLAAPERMVRVFLDAGTTLTRLARSAAETLRTEAGTELAIALGAPVRSRRTPDHTEILTERELLVFRYLPSRLTNAEIAGECFMSVNTVKTHLKSIYSKLGVSSRSEAIVRGRLLDQR